MDSYYLPNVITASKGDEQLLFATSNYCLSGGWTVAPCQKYLLPQEDEHLQFATSNYCL